MPTTSETYRANVACGARFLDWIAGPGWWQHLYDDSGNVRAKTLHGDLSHLALALSMTTNKAYRDSRGEVTYARLLAEGLIDETTAVAYGFALDPTIPLENQQIEAAYLDRAWAEWLYENCPFRRPKVPPQVNAPLIDHSV